MALEDLQILIIGPLYFSFSLQTRHLAILRPNTKCFTAKRAWQHLQWHVSIWFLSSFFYSRKFAYPVIEDPESYIPSIRWYLYWINLPDFRMRISIPIPNHVAPCTFNFNHIFLDFFWLKLYFHHLICWKHLYVYLYWLRIHVPKLYL